jgi:hypothetical protein
VLNVTLSDAHIMWEHFGAFRGASAPLWASSEWVGKTFMDGVKKGMMQKARNCNTGAAAKRGLPAHFL